MTQESKPFTINVSLTTAEFEAVQRLAKLEDRSLSSTMRRLVKQSLPTPPSKQERAAA